MDQVGSLLKMNPPVRTKDHADVLWQGLREGFVDMLLPTIPRIRWMKKVPTFMANLPSRRSGIASPASAALKPVSH